MERFCKDCIYKLLDGGTHNFRGWDNWDKSYAEVLVDYVEYGSYGPGAVLDRRVGWSKILSDEEAREYSVLNILNNGDGWDPEM